MSTATKLPSGKWRARAYNKFTGERPSFTADTKKEAERLAAAYNFRESKHGAIKFGDAAEIYIENRSAILSPNTIKDYKGTLNNHLEAIRNRKIDSISDTTIQVLLNDISKNHSPKTVKNVYGFITAVMRSVEPSTRFSVVLPKKIKHDLKMPSEADIKAILKEVTDTDMEVPVKLALYCCLRRGEVCGLLKHPECIDEDSVTVKYNIIHTTGGDIEKIPKTYTSFRTVPCPPDLASKAKTALQLSPDSITARWERMMKRMGMSYRFHDLRHASASMMLTIMPTVDVEKFGGWRHGSTVLQDIYTYNVDESLKRSASAWQEKLKTL